MSTTLVAPQAAPRKKYDPYAIRRCVRHVASQDGAELFVTKSFTQPSDEDIYLPRIDAQTGAVECDCGIFQHKLQFCNPTLATPDFWCKHIKRGVDALVRRGVLEKVLTREEKTAALRAEVRAMTPEQRDEILRASDDF